jgi:hypothetical protein
MAPEVFGMAPHDPRKADLWSCGVIIFVMLVGGAVGSALAARASAPNAATAFPFEFPHSKDIRFNVVMA